MAGTVKIGLVGAGDIGRVHALAYANLTDVELVVAKGRNPANAEKLAADVGATVADGYAVVLADESIDAVDLCVPNDLHLEFALAAAHAGKATLCEKPIALTLPDAERIVEAFGARDVPLMVAHVLRFWPEYATGRDIIRRGGLGAVRAFSARRMLSLLRAVEGAEGWRRAAQRTGGAALDLQIHDIDFVLWTFGMPQHVVARGAKSEYGSWDHVYTLLDYDEGPTVSIESSFMLNGDPVTIDYRAVGDDASLAFAFIETDFAMHDMHTDKTEQSRKHAASLVKYQWGRATETLHEQPDDPIMNAFENEMRAFVKLVRGEKDTDIPGPQQAVDALRVSLASLESCKTGKPITL